MLDLSYLKGKAAGAQDASAVSGVAAPVAMLDMDSAYAQYVEETLRLRPDAQVMSEDEFERHSRMRNPEGQQKTGWIANLRNAAKTAVQTCRLVIGIHDYEYYVDHMRSKHPGMPYYTREEFYRYCLEARFPSAERAGTGCPC